MSVVVRTPNGNCLLLSKGADNDIYNILNKSIDQPFLHATKHNILKLSQKGLRTLCMSMK